MDVDVDVVEDAVGREAGRHVLEVGDAATLAHDVRNGYLGVHAEEDRTVAEEVCEGSDGEECREEFEGVDVKLLMDCPVVEMVTSVMDCVEDAPRGEVGGVDIEGEVRGGGMYGTSLLVREECRE